MGDNAIGRVERAVGSLDDDAWFQDAGTGRAIYVRDLKPLLSLACSNRDAPKGDIGKRLCELHERVLRCFQGATGEPNPRRPRFFTPEWGDTETLLDAACALDRLSPDLESPE